MPDIPCANTSCTSESEAIKRCSACTAVFYEGCQKAHWTVHKEECKLLPPPSLSGLHFSQAKNSAFESVSDDWDFLNNIDTEYGNWLRRCIVLIKTAGGESVGKIRLEIINRAAAVREDSFFNVLDGQSDELARFALLFSDRGVLLPRYGTEGNRAWPGPTSIPRIVLLNEIDVKETWRGRGVGSWVIPRLFHLPILTKYNVNYLFAQPGTLTKYDPPRQNGIFGELTPEELASSKERFNKINNFFRKVGFRRIGNTEFFGLAKDPKHPSHSIPLEEDADYAQPAPPQTDEEHHRYTLIHGIPYGWMHGQR